jgi:hypothetical protein
MTTVHRPHGQNRRTIGAEQRVVHVLALLIVLVFVGGCGQLAGTNVDRGDPDETAAAFLRLYAAHDPAACDLVATELRSRFDSDGRCSGQPSDVGPQLDVLESRTCGDRHSFSAAVNPSGEVAAPFVTVGLELADGSWSVRSVLPLTERSVIRPFECAAPSTEYLGGTSR